MQAFFWAIASNTLFAALLACGVWLASKPLRRRPAVVHALWLLVLLKLVTPPLFDASAAWTALTPSPPKAIASHDVRRNEEPPDLTLGEMTAILERQLARARSEQQAAEAEASWWPAAFALAWGAGSAIFLALALYRAARFDRLVSAAPLADAKLQRLAWEQAEQLGLSAAPAIKVVEACISPLVWRTPFRTAVVLPAKLVRELGLDQLRLLLAHELAHLRRGDPLVRWFSLGVLTLHWWNPVVWLAIRQIEAAQEACCDSLVLSASGASPKRYAEMLLITVDFLAGQATPPPALAAGFTSGNSLKGRCEMILSKRTPFALARTTRWMLAALGMAILPLSTPLLGQEEKKPSSEELAARVERMEKALEEMKALLMARKHSEEKVREEREVIERALRKQEQMERARAEADEARAKAEEAHARAKQEAARMHDEHAGEATGEFADLHRKIAEEVHRELAKAQEELSKLGELSAEQAAKLKAEYAEKVKAHVEAARRHVMEQAEHARKHAAEVAREMEKHGKAAMEKELPRLKEHFAQMQEQMKLEAEKMAKIAEQMSKNPEMAEELARVKERMADMKAQMGALREKELAKWKELMKERRRGEDRSPSDDDDEHEDGDDDMEEEKEREEAKSKNRREIEERLRDREERIRDLQREVEKLRRELGDGAERRRSRSRREVTERVEEIPLRSKLPLGIRLFKNPVREVELDLADPLMLDEEELELDIELDLEMEDDDLELDELEIEERESEEADDGDAEEAEAVEPVQEVKEAKEQKAAPEGEDLRSAIEILQEAAQKNADAPKQP